MPFLKNIGHDLIEKRLWPVAVLLVLALVAVPVLLGGGSAQRTGTRHFYTSSALSTIKGNDEGKAKDTDPSI